MGSMQLHDSSAIVACSNFYFTISSFIQCTNISTIYIDDSDYRRGKTSFEYVNVTKCIRVKSFVEALTNMVCELKITAGSKKIV